MNLIHKKPLLTILLCYILWALCYPPFILGPLSCVILVPALKVTFRLSIKQSVVYHFWGGLAHNFIMYYWLYNVMKVGPALIILAGVVLLIAYLSLYYAYLGWVAKYFQDLKYGWAGYALIWVGIEMIRTVGQISFPWSHIGYTWGHHLVLIQVASYIGIFGISFIIISLNFKVAVDLENKKYSGLGILVGVFVFLVLLGTLQLNYLSDGTEHQTMDISLVQPSIEQTKKWDEEYFMGVMNQTWQIMDSSDLEGSDLIILAETAIPAFLPRRPEIEADFKERALKLNSDIIVGSLDYEYNDHPAKPFRFYNSAFLFFGDSGRDYLQYSKLRLVPFSERLPFENVFPIINYVNLGEGDFSEGDDYKVWGSTTPYSPSICYEIVYPDFVRETVRRGAKFLVNITNDGWFGRSPAAYQHANIARFRAVESGIVIVRCSNSGISIFYDNKGRILGKTKLFEKTVLRRKIPIKTRSTVYHLIGGAMETFIFYAFLLFNFVLLVFFIREKFFSSRPKRSR